MQAVIFNPVLFLGILLLKEKCVQVQALQQSVRVPGLPQEEEKGYGCPHPLIRGRQDGENSREDPGTRERGGEPGMQAARCD